MASYGTDQGLEDYLAETGRAIPSGVTLSSARYNGTLYVDQFEHKFMSHALTDANSFPRQKWPVVPARVEYAAYEAGYAYATGVDIFGSGGSFAGQVVKERVDVLSVDYAGPQDGMGYWEANMFILPRAYALLLPFFRRGGAYGAAFVV